MLSSFFFVMEKCERCGAETELFVGGIPICLKCQEELAPKDPLDHVPKPPQRASIRQIPKTRENRN